MLSVDELFKGRHFDREIIVLCVRWYLRYKFSFRDLVEMMAERGLSLAHTTIMRWIQRYVPEFEKRWSRFARLAGRSWRVDETYVKIKAARQTGRRRGQGLLPAGLHGPGSDCRIRLRSMAIRPLIGRPKRLSTNIQKEINARSDPQNI
jgi:hypothetical protein